MPSCIFSTWRSPSGPSIWMLNVASFALMACAIALETPSLAIAAFIALAVLQNFWRPILVGRCAATARSEATATILSIESQAKAIFTAVAAPIMGVAVDAMTQYRNEWRLIPVASLGLILSLLVLAAGRHHRKKQA